MRIILKLHNLNISTHLQPVINPFFLHRKFFPHRGEHNPAPATWAVAPNRNVWAIIVGLVENTGQQAVPETVIFTTYFCTAAYGTFDF